MSAQFVDAGLDTGELALGQWLREVRAILTDADASSWRAERAEDLRRRVTAAVASVRARLGEGDAASDAAADVARIARAHSLVATMERTLPAEPTRARWAAFVGAVHPEYEALILALPAEVAPSVIRPTNYTRSLFHFAGAAVGLGMVALVRSHTQLVMIAVGLVTYAWTMELGRRHSPRLNDWLMRLYGHISHPHERYRINSATWYSTALLILALFMSRPATMASLAVLGVADPFAALIGRRWGRHRFQSGRSLEGMLAFFVSGSGVAALALVFAGVTAPVPVVALSLVAGAVGAVVEMVTGRLDDNLTIPVSVGAAVTLASRGLTSLM